jgi:hypothetical protein
MKAWLIPPVLVPLFLLLALAALILYRGTL